MKIWGLRFACVVSVIGVIAVLLYPGRPHGDMPEPTQPIREAEGVVVMLRMSESSDPQYYEYEAMIKRVDGVYVTVDSASLCYWLWVHAKPGDRVKYEYRDVGYWSPDIVVVSIKLIR